MRQLHWTTEHAVFEGEFDAEHRELFRLGEEVRLAHEAGADAQAIGEAVRRLAAAAEAHFAHEERMMRSARYSGYAWHKHLHDGARERLQSLAAEPDELVTYLARWLREHTAVADRMMASSLRNAGRARAAAS